MSPTAPLLPFNQKKRLLVVQLGAVLAALVLVVTQPAWKDDLLADDLLESLGALLVVGCILGRLWSTLYIGGRKNGELVTTGPFSTTRNPLYFFSTVGAVGVGLMFGSLLVALVLGVLTYQIFRFTAAREAAFLSEKFGPAYAAYARDTPIFWPDPRRYRDSAKVYFSPRRPAPHLFRRALFHRHLSGDGTARNPAVGGLHPDCLQGLLTAPTER